MADEDTVFDPTQMKKKKKTKLKPFDLDAALSSDPSGAADQGNGPSEKENQEPAAEQAVEDPALLELDLESFGKKKKRSKKPVLDLEVLEKKEAEEESSAAGELGLDFTEKKKKKKKKDLEELVQAGEGVEGPGGDEEEDEGDEDGGAAVSGPVKSAWLGSDRDYTYDELLNRVFDIMRIKNPEMVSGTKQKFVMRPPQVVRVGTKKTSFVNFMEICKMLHRHQKHLLDFLLSELGTSGSIDGNNQLIIKGRFQQKQIENVLRRYIKEYVTCHTCRSPNTLLQKDSRIFFLQCEACGSRCSVVSIKHGFQAVTGKRAAIRAKAT